MRTKLMYYLQSDIQGLLAEKTNRRNGFLNLRNLPAEGGFSDRAKFALANALARHGVKEEGSSSLSLLVWVTNRR